MIACELKSSFAWAVNEVAMWSLGNHKRRLLALTIAAAVMLVIGGLAFRGDIAHSDSVEQDPQIYLPLVMKRYCTDGWEDDFSDPNSGWRTWDDEDSKVEYLAGEFHVWTGPSVIQIFVRTSPWIYATDFTLEVDGRSDLAFYGLVFAERTWYENATYHWEWYSFELGPGNYWVIYKTDRPESWKVVLDSGYSSYITSGMNHLKIVRDGPLIEAYVNGYLLSTVTDSSFLGSRWVALTAGSLGTTPVDAYFDNFAICPVDSVPGASATGMGEVIIFRKGTPPTIEFWLR